VLGSARHPRRELRPTLIPPSQAHGPSPRIQLLGMPYPMIVLREKRGAERDEGLSNHMIIKSYVAQMSREIVKRLQDEPEPRFRKFINGSGSSSDAR